MSSRAKASADLTVTTGESALPWRDLTFPQAISRALSELKGENGRKAIAPYFDGRDKREVAETTVSRWITEPTRFPAHCLPVLVAVHEGFRSYLFQHMAARMTTPAEMMKRLSPATAKEYEKAFDEQMRRIAFGQGGAGEHYA